MADDGYHKIRDAGREIEQAGRDLQNVTELRPEPVAMVELTETELEELLDYMGRFSKPNEDALSAIGKLNQALAIESGPHGAFDTGPEAA